MFTACSEIKYRTTKEPRSSLGEGDEQLDRRSRQTSMEFAMHVLRKFFRFNINTTAFCLGLHLLPLKSSMKEILSLVLTNRDIKFRHFCTQILVFSANILRRLREIKKIKKAPSAKDYCGGRARRNILISCNTLASIWRNQANRIFQINCISN